MKGQVCWKTLELTPKKTPGVKWSDKNCDFCDMPPNDLVAEVRLRNPENKGFNICPTCAAVMLRVILSSYDGPRERLAVVLHDIWGLQMEPVLPLLERLAGNFRASLGARDRNDPWTREMLNALHKDELAVKRWQAKVMAGFVDLHDVEQREYYEQAGKVLEALGVWVEPAEVEYEGKMGVFTSARLRTEGDHDKVQIWNRGGLAGELVCKKGDGDTLLTRLGMWPTEEPERERLRNLRSGHEAGCCELTGATEEYIRALEDYVKKTVPDLDKE